MTVESLAIDNCASFRKQKDFPVVSNELRFLTSTPHLGKEQPMPVDESNLNSESNLNNKHSEIQDIGRFYQIIHLDILASTYSAIACPDCFNTSCVELKKAKNRDFHCNFVYRARYVNFVNLSGHQRKLRK